MTSFFFWRKKVKKICIEMSLIVILLLFFFSDKSWRKRDFEHFELCSDHKRCWKIHGLSRGKSWITWCYIRRRMEIGNLLYVFLQFFFNVIHMLFLFSILQIYPNLYWVWAVLWMVLTSKKVTMSILNAAYGPILSHTKSRGDSMWVSLMFVLCVYVVLGPNHVYKYLKWILK